MVRLCINKYRICEIYFEKFDNKNVKRFKFWFWNSIWSVTVGLQEHGIGTVIFKINWSQCNPNRMLYLEELNQQLFFQFSFILNKPQNWWNRLSFSKELSRCHKLEFYITYILAILEYLRYQNSLLEISTVYNIAKI